MDPFTIGKTNNTPSVEFDPEEKTFDLKGKSIPEDPKTFYKSVLDWIDQYVTDPLDHLTVNVRLEYFNTSTSKILFTIFKKLESMPRSDQKVEINWFFEEGDYDLLESGEDYEALLKIPFNVIEVPE